MGWALDAFDVLLYVFALTTIMKEWHCLTSPSRFLSIRYLVCFGLRRDRLRCDSQFHRPTKSLNGYGLIFSVMSGVDGLTRNIGSLLLPPRSSDSEGGNPVRYWFRKHGLLSIEVKPLESCKGAGQSGTSWRLWFRDYSPWAWLACSVLHRNSPAPFTAWIRTKVEEPENLGEVQ